MKLDTQGNPIGSPADNVPELLRRPEETFIVSPKSYDLDTPKLENTITGETEPVRQLYSNFTERASASPAAVKDTNFFNSVYVGEPAKKVADEGPDVFSRTKGRLEVDGMDKTMIDFIATGTGVWSNYGFAERGTKAYEDYKWFASDLMEENYEAADLLKEDPEPTTIISDEDYLDIDKNVQIIQQHYAVGGNAESAKAASKYLSANREKTVAYAKRTWLAKMNQLPHKRAMVTARLNDMAMREDYEHQYGRTSDDVNRYQDTGFLAGLKTGWDTNILQSMRGMQRGHSNKRSQMDVWLHKNTDLEPELIVDAFSQFSEGKTPEQISIDIHSKEATRNYKQFEVDSKGAATGNVGMALGEFGGNPINWLLMNPISKGGMLLASKVPAVVRPVVAGGAIGATESFINDYSGGKNFTQEEINQRALGTAIGGAAIFSAFKLGQYGLQSWSKGIAADIKDPKLSNVTDEFNKGIDVAEANTTSAVERALIQAGEDRVKGRMQEQVKIDRVVETAREQYRPDVTVWQKTTQLKQQLREVYEELGIKGHSKFKTKDAIAKELQSARMKQAEQEQKAIFAKNKLDKAKRLEEEQLVKANKEARDKADTEQAAIDKEKAKADAQADLELAQVNKDRVEKGEKPFSNVTEDGFEDALTSTRQKTALEESAQDAADRVAARKSLSVFSKAYDAFTRSVGLHDMTSKGLNFDDSAVKYLASKVLETGAGYAGRMSRPATAALIKDTIFKREYSNIMGSYQKNMNEWAAKKGLNYFQNVNARNVGSANQYADEFHKTMYLAQERMAMGDKVTDLDPAVQSFIKDWDTMMDNLFVEARDAGVKGFGKNKRAHYVPRVWKKQKVEHIAKLYGEENLRKLLKESIESAQRKGNTFKEMDDTTVNELVERQVNWINGLGDAMTSYKPGRNNRTKARAPLDMTVGIKLSDGKMLRMIDLVDTNIPTMASTYGHRTAGSIGLARATKGAIRDEGDFAKFAEQAGSDEAKQFVQDVGDMQFGYPTREGMNPAARMLMDSAQYAQLETLGVAQLATVGTSLQAVVANWASHPQVAKQILRMANQGSEDTMMRSIRERSAVNRNIKFSNRADVHNLDQAQLDEITDFSLAMNKAVDTLTGGDLKPLLSRGLGKLSGYDAVARYQSRLTQASFTMETARQSVLGKSSFSDKRLVDLGIKEVVDGKIVDGDVAKAYKEHVEFTTEGELKDMHFDKWSDDQMRQYTYAMNRYEAQIMPYIMNGELPQFMNMPEMQFVLHYLKTPLAFGTKGTGRQLGFADKEAALAVTLNTMSAGLVRYAYTAGTGAAYSAIKGDNVDMTPDQNAMQIHNYLDWLGYGGEIYNKGNAAYQAVTNGIVDPLSTQLPPAVKQLHNMATVNPAALPTLVPGFEKVSTAIIEQITEASQ